MMVLASCTNPTRPVTKKTADSVQLDNPLGKTRPAPVSAVDSPVHAPDSPVERVVIAKGGSLCGSLKVTPGQAKEIAVRCHLHHYWKNGTFFVSVFVGNRFVKRNGIWEVARLRIAKG